MYFLSPGWGMSPAAPGWPLHMHPENCASLAPVAVLFPVYARKVDVLNLHARSIAFTICIWASTFSWPWLDIRLTISLTIHCSESTTWRKLDCWRFVTWFFLHLSTQPILFLCLSMCPLSMWSQVESCNWVLQQCICYGYTSFQSPISGHSFSW
jgi:hypothetical protein